MKKQRPEIDPNASFLQSLVNGVDIVKNIVGSVQKETSSDTIELLKSLTIDILKLTTYYGKVRLILSHIVLDILGRGNIRDLNWSEKVLIIIVILAGAYKRMNSELFGLFCLIDDEIGAVKHEKCDFIAFST